MAEGKAPGFGGIVGAGLYFGSNGAAFAALLPWYPLLIERLGLSSWQFGLVVACMAVGALSSSVLPSRLIARFGATSVAIGGTVVLVIAVELAAWSVAGWMMAACLFLAGFVDAIVDVAQNVVGIAVQEASSKVILSSMHALWSLGGLLSGALATAAASAGMDIRVHLGISGFGCLVLILIGTRLIGGDPHRERRVDTDAVGEGQAPASPGRRRRILTIALPLAVVAVCGTAVEDIANNWAALAAVQLGGVPVAMAGIAFSTVIGSQCLGRFTGDVLVHRFGAGRIARLGGGLIAVGGIGLVTASGPVQLLLSLAALGYGSATLVPGALNAAAHIPGARRAAGVTLVSWLMRVSFMATSPLVGVVTTAVGLRWGLGVLIVIGAATMVFAGRLDVARDER